ncbi:putative ATP-dependent endonuclease of OLD family [Variovorax beijingensis]|uniref:Putative ATP-dependent endonuclease of OLD family n=1 Tax=Variovorax beijingensis TaxID=2496117 RepID=A0A561C5R1_9BURK|nr:AAA family ATPase [Variovorax beijingensis]TWD86378.1 putative ATP-dependent endonuclease of OLD family [Variovorax beijingensis]
MRLAGLHIKNYKCIGDTERRLRIDGIVVLIGQNNAGKSTILDAYEAFASAGAARDHDEFHREDLSRPIEITGVFNEVNAADEDAVGKKWTYDDAEYGQCLKVRWVWSKPGEKGLKQSFNPTADAFEDGGMGGWDSQIQSRIPQPLRIRPTESVETTQTKIAAMLKDHVKTRLKADSSATKNAFAQIEALAKSIFDDSKAAFDDVAARINASVSNIFPGTAVELIPRSKDALNENIIGADSYLKVTTAGGDSTPLLLQGTGLQRALLWSALAVMADKGDAKKKSAAVAAPRILLIDEPEAFLHPPTIRSARDALYDFATGNPDWQVIATTHSPVFIDLSKNHTTIIRVDADPASEHYISTDSISFDEDERTRLKMVRACHPVVNEFFFYNNIVLVEGPTEHLVVKHVAGLIGTDVHVIDCMGKANVPLFARILNHFKVPYVAIHDADTPFIRRKKKLVKSGTWTVNEQIRNSVAQSNGSHVFTQFPHFEGEFFGEELTSGKVDRVLEALDSKESGEYQRIVDTYSRVLRRDGGVMTTTHGAFETKRDAHIQSNGLEDDPLWSGREGVAAAIVVAQQPAAIELAAVKSALPLADGGRAGGDPPLQ